MLWGMRKITIMWAGKPIGEQELTQKLSVPFWEPRVFAGLPPDEQRAYLKLNWWEAKVQRHLPHEAREFYRHLDETRSRVRFGDTPFAEQLTGITDPVDRLAAINDALTLLMAVMNEVSRLRRETLLEAEGCGVSTRELADVMHVTLPRVRQLVLEARRKAGLPIDPQYGGRNKRKSDGETRG